MEPVTTLRPGDRLAEFEVIRQLGRGGMGIVYLVRDERLERQVALKVVAPHLAHDPEFQERFAAEARSAAAIEHPNAVTVYSAGSADGHLFIAMRYVEGTDLRRSMAESGPLEPRTAARVVVEVGGALDVAHAAGFVHRDVKPANILLTGPPGEGTAYLTDFGLTRGLGSAQVELTATGQWIGTLDYVAPEQIAAGRIDARTDIYSLGCVFYEMLAGSVPFRGDEMQKLWRKANEAPPPLPSSSPGSPHPLDPVLARAIAKDPEQRFRSASDLGRAALAAAGADTDAPTERSVATGVAAAGLREADVRIHGRRPLRVDPPTARMPQARRQPAPPPPPALPPPQPRRRSAGRAAAIIGCALAVAGGLIVGALVLAKRQGETTRTVVTRPAPAKAETGAEATASSTTEGAVPANEGRVSARESTAVDPEAGPPVSFNGSEYSATLPAGWIQQDNEKVASDGSYVQNTWVSPDGDEELLIDESPGSPADPAKSVAKIASDVRQAEESVYAVTNGVERGGLTGSELDFHADSGLPERADFFFNVGDNGFAILASGYDLEAAQERITPVVASLQMSYPAAP